MLYIIRNKVTGELWGNEDGWSNSFADVFTEDERNTLDLPIDGEWIEK